MPFFEQEEARRGRGGQVKFVERLFGVVAWPSADTAFPVSNQCRNATIQLNLR